LAVSLIFQKLTLKKEQHQLLSDNLLFSGKYLKITCKIINKTKRDALLKQTFVLQNKITEKHEIL
jgi:hypothetical protein